MKKDIAKKRLEEHNDVYADIFNALLFEGRPVLQEESLVPLPTEAFTRRMMRRDARPIHGGSMMTSVWCR